MFRIGSASWSAHPLIRHSATGSLSKFRSLEPQTLAVLPPWRIKSVKGMSRTAYTFRQMWKHSAWTFQTPPEYYVSVCLGEEESLMDVAAIGMKHPARSWWETGHCDRFSGQLAMLLKQILKQPSYLQQPVKHLLRQALQFKVCKQLTTCFPQQNCFGSNSYSTVQGLKSVSKAVHTYGHTPTHTLAQRLNLIVQQKMQSHCFNLCKFFVSIAVQKRFNYKSPPNYPFFWKFQEGSYTCGLICKIP